jgi:hypothetical protein
MKNERRIFPTKNRLRLKKKGCVAKKRAPEKKDRFVVTATIKNFDFETRFLKKTEIAN